MSALAGRAAARLAPDQGGGAWLGAALGGGVAIAYALLAYEVGPAAFPVAVIAAGAVLLGLFRIEYGIALLILLTPIAENAPINDPAGAPLRVALSLWLVILIAIEVGRQLVTSERLRPPPLFGAALALGLVTMVSVGLAPDLADAAASYLAVIGSISLYLLIAIRLRDWERLKPVLAAIVVVGLAISIHSIWQYATGDLTEAGSFLTAEGEVEQRIASTFTHPNQLGGFLAILVALGAGLSQVFQSYWGRAACWSMTTLAAVATVLTFSRGALLAIAALGLFYAVSRRAWPLLVAGVVAVVLLAPSTLGERFGGIEDPQNPEVATRIDLWDAGLQAFAEAPVAGVGLNGYAASYVATERTGRTFLGSGTPFAVPENAHNLYINTLAEQGLIGFAALLLVVLLAFRLAFSLRGSPQPRVRGIGLALLGALIVVLVHGIFDLTLFDPKSSVLMWTILGAAAAASQFDPAQDPD